MTKIKHVRTADCVVAGYRVHKTRPRRDRVSSFGLHVETALPSQRNDAMSGLAPVGVIGAFPMSRRRELFAELQPDRRRQAPVELGRRECDRAPRAAVAGTEEGPVVRGAAAAAGRRGAPRLSGGRAVPPPAAVRALAPRPRPGLLRFAQLDQPTPFDVADVLAGRLDERV